MGNSSSALAAFGLYAIAMTCGSATADDRQERQSNVWTHAESAIADYLKRVDPSFDPSIRYAEFRSDLLRKYLPDLRLYVRTDRHIVGHSRIFVVNQRSEVTDLGEGVWNGDKGYYRDANITKFIKSRNIKIRSGDDAIEVAKLTEEVHGADSYVGFLQVNTQGYTVFDKHFLEWFVSEASRYKYSAVSKKDGWIVKREYVGPPAMVRAPPTYEIDIDQKEMFNDIRWFDSFSSRN